MNDQQFNNGQVKRKFGDSFLKQQNESEDQQNQANDQPFNFSKKQRKFGDSFRNQQNSFRKSSLSINFMRLDIIKIRNEFFLRKTLKSIGN